jgi:hypothetical protein
VQRTGGVAGTVTMRAEADTDQLSEPEAAELMALADKVRAASQGPGPIAAGAGPKYDQMEYSITIEREGRREQVTFTESQLTPEIRAVADRLILEEARRRKGR